ncbi:MAG: M56 family metallopeptidase [Bacteroidia bacterium]|nr:M56 family metallopeptidase [Bacteroidia bacterium]
MTSFSFFRHIVMSREDYEHNPVIIQHEMMHVECLHSVDILFFSIITALHWFNPLVWLARNELKEVQEYEADEAVLKQGIDATQYQLLLVKKAVGAEHFRMANGFNHSKLKNRIKMMQTKKTNKLARLAYLACIPILLGTLCFCTDQNKDKSGTSDKDSTSNEEIIPFQLLDETPKFNGEDANAFAKWVSEQLVYPESAKEAGTGGRVYVSFVIDENGNITDVKTIKSISEDLDNEAIRVVSSSPAWEPGKKDGRTVKVTYTLPVIFELR